MYSLGMVTAAADGMRLIRDNTIGGDREMRPSVLLPFVRESAMLRCLDNKRTTSSMRRHSLASLTLVNASLLRRLFRLSVFDALEPSVNRELLQQSNYVICEETGSVIKQLSNFAIFNYLE